RTRRRLSAFRFSLLRFLTLFLVRGMRPPVVKSGLSSTRAARAHSVPSEGLVAASRVLVHAFSAPLRARQRKRRQHHLPRGGRSARAGRRRALVPRDPAA